MKGLSLDRAAESNLQTARFPLEEEAGMIRGTIALLALVVVAGCGADGAPERPASELPGLVISGTAKLGVKYCGDKPC